MFRKPKPLTLLLIFIGLLIAVILILRMDARKQQGSFLKHLIDADKNKASSLVVIPKGNIDNAITLDQTDDKWFVTSQGKSYQADPEMMERIFQAIAPMTTQQLVARHKDGWAEFQVTDDLGTRVKIYYGNRLSHEFVFGRIHLEQQMVQGRQSPKISTYARIATENDVYTVPGFLGSVFPAAVKQYRDQTVIAVSNDDVASIKVQGPGEYSYELTRSGEVWMLNNMPALDEPVAHLLESLGSLTSQAFVEEEAEGWITLPSHRMTIQQTNAPAIEVHAYAADTTYRYFITSSQNKGAVFNGLHDGLFETIFNPADFFLTTVEPGENPVD